MLYEDVGTLSLLGLGTDCNVLAIRIYSTVGLADAIRGHLRPYFFLFVCFMSDFSRKLTKEPPLRE